MSNSRFPSFRDLINIIVRANQSSAGLGRIDEGRRWIDGASKRNIAIDDAHAGGQEHGHVRDRKGRELLVVNRDGSKSHNKGGRLTKPDAEALRGEGFKIPKSRLIEQDLRRGPPSDPEAS